MKKSYLIFSILCLSVLSSNSQSIEMVDPTSCVLGSIENTDDFEIDAHWDVINTSSESKVIRVRREIVSEINGSRNKFCWGPLCYNWDTDESPTAENLLVTMAAGSTNSTFSCYYQHQGYPGQTTVRYCFFDNNNESDETCWNVNYAVDVDCVVGIQEYTNAGLLELNGPNPVVGTSSLVFNHQGENARFEMINLLGEVVKVAPISNQQGMIVIDAQDFENGTYICNLIVDGAVSSSVRVVVAR